MILQQRDWTRQSRHTTMKCPTLAAGGQRAAGRRPMGRLGGVLTAVILASIAGRSAALVNPVGQARSGRSRAAHGGGGGGGGWQTSAKSPLGLETGGFGRVRPKRSRSESGSGSDSVFRVQAFWDTGRVGAAAAGRKKVADKAKPKFVSPVPEGFPPASTLLRPDEVDYTLGNFLDFSREMFKKNNPSLWQSARFRLKPLGRIPSRTRILRITLDGGASLNLVPKPQVFGMKELDLYGCTTALKTAAHDPRIKGVLMDLSSVDMSMATIMEVRRAMDYFTQSGKPLWGFTENSLDMTLLCLMGGCTKRIAAPEAYVNLLGFSFETQFFRGFFDQVGIEPQVRRIGEFKSFGDTYARDSMSAAQREVTESLLSAASGFKGGLLARDAGDKTMSDVEDLYNSDDPITVDKLTAFGLLDDAMYQDQMLDAFNVEVDRRTRKGGGGKEESGGGESGASTSEKKPMKTNKKKKRLVETSKLIIPATVYLRRIRRSEVEGVPGGKGDKTIAVINAEGPIVNSASGGQGNLLVPNFRDQVNGILRDSSVEGVVVRISSPGGDALSSDLMWREVRRLREAGKVVVASVCNVAASGGYYIAMGCETIVCDELSITGSIGVVQAKFAIGELIDKLGFKIERVSKGKYAELFAAERGFTKEEDAWWSRNAMNSYNDFVSKAAMSRRMPLEDMKRRAQGRVWTGAQAKALGLIDELGGLDRAIEVCRDMVDLKKLATDKYRVARKKARREAKKENQSAGKSTGVSMASSSNETTPEKSSSAAMVVRAVTAEGEEFEDFGANNDWYPLPKGEVPYGPLGRVIPEKYSALEEQVVQEARDELEKKREAASKSGKGRLTRVKNIVPGGSGFLGFVSSNLNQDDGGEDWMARFGISTPRSAEPSASTLLKGLGSLVSADTARPMAVLDDDIARMMPGISGVPEDLRRLGVGPLLYSFLQRSPGLAESLVEVLGKVGLSSLLD